MCDEFDSPDDEFSGEDEASDWMEDYFGEFQNLAELIRSVAQGQPIECVVIGNPYSADSENIIPDEKLHTLLPWPDAVSLLDYTFRGEHCHRIIAWTPSRIIFTESIYDSYDPQKVYVTWKPRHPTADFFK